MKSFLNTLGGLQPATLVLMIFAAVLLILLVVLIVVTIKVLKAGEDEYDDDESYDDDDEKSGGRESDTEDEEEDDEDEEEEDETTKKINEAVRSVAETKAKVEAEKEAREAARERVEEITKSVQGKSDESEDEYEPISPDDEKTGELDTTKIREELLKSKQRKAQEAEEAADSAAHAVETAAEAGASSAETAAEEGAAEKAAVAAAAAGAAIVAAKETEEEVKPKKTKKKTKKSNKPAVSADAPKSFWYNQQDMEGLVRQEDKYFKYHYFSDPDDAILDLITEMYDCAYVRTEQLQRIAYGITFKSLGMKEILQSEEKIGFSKEGATKEPTETDKEEIYNKWCEYVESFLKIIEIEAPEDVKKYIIDQMNDYGHKDVEELMYSPY